MKRQGIPCEVYREPAGSLRSLSPLCEGEHLCVVCGEGDGVWIEVRAHEVTRV